jgi:hypothetical protein
MECLFGGALPGSLGGDALLPSWQGSEHAARLRSDGGPQDWPRTFGQGSPLIIRNDVGRRGVVAVGWRASTQLVDTIVGCNLTSASRRGSGDPSCVLLSCSLTLKSRLQGPWPMVGWHATCSGVSEQGCAVAISRPPSTGRVLRNAQADGPGRCYRRCWQRWGHCNCHLCSIRMPPGVGQLDTAHIVRMRCRCWVHLIAEGRCTRHTARCSRLTIR